MRGSAGGAIGGSNSFKWLLSVYTISPACWRSENTACLVSMSFRFLIKIQDTHGVFFESSLESLGELIPLALGTFGTEGVSNAAFLFAVELFARGSGVFGTRPSSLQKFLATTSGENIQCQIHIENIPAFPSISGCSICAFLINTPNMGLSSRFSF